MRQDGISLSAGQLSHKVITQTIEPLIVAGMGYVCRESNYCGTTVDSFFFLLLIFVSIVQFINGCKNHRPVRFRCILVIIESPHEKLLYNGIIFNYSSCLVH